MDFFCWKMLLMYKKVKQRGFGVCVFLFLFCLSFLHIPYHKRLSEPVATDYLNTDLAHTPVLIVYGTYLEPTE